MPLAFFDQLQRILPFANKVADEMVCKETEILEKTIPRMFEVMRMVANFSCDYVKRGRFGRQLSSLDLASTNSRRENDAWAGPPK